MTPDTGAGAEDAGPQDAGPQDGSAQDGLAQDAGPGDTARDAPGGWSGGRPIEPGLHFIATPIGAARDITLRALDILAGADVLAAEDTRSLRRLMEIHGVALRGRRITALHDHNWPAVRARLAQALAAGQSVAYASEAGTPLVADPGYQLARAAIDAGHKVLAAPGPSAVLAALMVSGLPSDRFLFAGFPPSAAGERRRFLADLAQTRATLILYESPKRIRGLLGDMLESFGEGREIALCRELTKRFEEVRRGTLGAVTAALDGVEVRGEIVLVVDRAPAAEAPTEAVVLEALRAALVSHRLRDAAGIVAARFGMARRDVYQLGLGLGGGALDAEG